MPDPIDPLTGGKYVLQGRVLTMGTPGVLPDGAVFIDGGVIRAVQPASQSPPAGFETAPRIRTGDTLYPGLIELHNHLSYNAMPLWDVPSRFSNNNQWKNHDDYRRKITKPSQTLGRTPGVVEALVRFVECRCLLGGVTTSQGITLASASGIESLYKGIVRNVEHTGDPALPHAGTRIANPANGEAAEYLANLADQSCYLQHLSEGTDPTARGWFHRLKLADGSWAVTEALCGIHSTALTVDDFRIMKERGGSMVWSPLSNYLLYGGTVDLKAARDAGIAMGLGCDWAPSGSKNLLGEMKIAWLASLDQGGDAGPVLSAEEIVRMVTIAPARILKWDSALGSIEPGKRADLIAVDGQTGDDFLRLIEARETSITLVVIGGIPRVGQKRLMERFGPGTEEIALGSSRRILNLRQETSHPLVQGLTLTEATARLADAMRRLPELAEAIDNALASGLFSGSADSTGTTWRVVLDFDEEEPDLTLADLPLADFVSPMELAPLTVADDDGFLRQLVRARNLPEFVKRGLPALYGVTIPLPPSAEFLESPAVETSPELVRTTVTLGDFLRTSGELSRADRLTIVEQALLLLEQNYVHLPLKRAMHAVDPLQQLRVLRHRLEQTGEGELPPEIEFHNELAGIFNSLRDLHTSYRLPRPFKGKTAWLPFLIEEFWEHDRRKFLVTKVVGQPGPPSFVQGVEVLYWNGVPIEKTIAANADRQAGGNPAARFARGLSSLTIRPLTHGLPPDEEWVTLRYLTADGQILEYTQSWFVSELGRSERSLDLEAVAQAALAIGVDARMDEIQEAKRALFAAKIVRLERAASKARSQQRVRNTASGPATLLPTILRAEPIETSRGVFAYVRIFSFNVGDAAAFVEEFVRLVSELPQEGLILDVRGNGGGLIHAAERLLQVLTPRTIEPERAQFLNTALNLRLCRKHAPSGLFQGFSLKEWIPSIEQSVVTGAGFSLGFPITAVEDCNDVGQKYHGPVLLITDPLCYSATDIFAAGFQDHEIGPILGVGPNTGAGGANVWSHGLLRALAGEADGESPSTPPYRSLPGGADMLTAVRRMVRVGVNAGGVIEDLGITPTQVHRMTRKDLLEGNKDLIERAAEMLSSLARHGIRVELEARGGRLPRARVVTRNVNRLDVAVNGRPRSTFEVERDAVEIELDRMVGVSEAAPLLVELRGYEGDRLVVSYRDRVGTA
jgi:cytosine/adenosine deaminase-related metal-dependent hydrolase/C-terminal processing protease CtpA/Prc